MLGLHFAELFLELANSFLRCIFALLRLGATLIRLACATDGGKADRYKIRIRLRIKIREDFVDIYFIFAGTNNAKNILNVYNATGAPDDDGYLTSAKYQTEIRGQLDTEAFIQMYQIYVNNGGNYSTPRQIKVGASFNF